MIKCPRCNNTAQIDIKGYPFERWNGQLGITCECGCGCRFNVLYNYAQTEITN